MSVNFNSTSIFLVTCNRLNMSSVLINTHGQVSSYHTKTQSTTKIRVRCKSDSCRTPGQPRLTLAERRSSWFVLSNTICEPLSSVLRVLIFFLETKSFIRFGIKYDLNKSQCTNTANCCCTSSSPRLPSTVPGRDRFVGTV